MQNNEEIEDITIFSKEPLITSLIFEGERYEAWGFETEDGRRFGMRIKKGLEFKVISVD